MAEENSTNAVEEGLNGEQPMQSLKDDLPEVSGVAAAAAVPASPRPASSGKGPSPLLEQFRAFAKFGDSKADGKAISLSQSDKWMKQVIITHEKTFLKRWLILFSFLKAKVIDGKKITATDTGIYFKKLKYAHWFFMSVYIIQVYLCVLIA